MEEAHGDDPRHAIKLGLVVVALAAGFAVLPRATRGCAGPSVQTEAPDFTTQLVANAPADPSFTLSAQRGHPVVLDFWATWCGPCQIEAPIVHRLAERYRDRGLVVVGVNTSDEAGLAQRWASSRGIGFPIAYDVQNAIAHKFGVENLPTLILISKTGKVLAFRQGLTTEAELDRLVKQAL